VFEDLRSHYWYTCKKTFARAFLHANEPFSHTAVQLRLALMKTPPHPKNQGNTKSINMESSNCHRIVTISVLVSRSYPVKNKP